MNAREYATYEAAVARFLRTCNVRPGCYCNVTPEAPTVNEFSSRPCECCHRHLAGSRERYHFGTEAGLMVAEICPDCVYYLAYGRLDDMTMLDIDAQEVTP